MIVSYEKHDLSIQKNILNLYAYTCRKLLFLFNRVYLEFSFLVLFLLANCSIDRYKKKHCPFNYTELLNNSHVFNSSDFIEVSTQKVSACYAHIWLGSIFLSC